MLFEGVFLSRPDLLEVMGQYVSGRSASFVAPAPVPVRPHGGRLPPLAVSAVVGVGNIKSHLASGAPTVASSL